MKLSKCCHQPVYEYFPDKDIYYCRGCNIKCDTIEQEEEEVKDKSFNSDYCKGYIQGQMDAFNGKIQNLKELNITEKVNVIPELQEYFKKLGKQESIDRVIEAFQLELKDLPFLPNPDKLLETIIAFGMAKKATQIQKETRNQVIEEIRKEVESMQGDCIIDPFGNDNEFISKGRFLTFLNKLDK